MNKKKQCGLKIGWVFDSEVMVLVAVMVAVVAAAAVLCWVLADKDVNRLACLVELSHCLD